MANLHSVEKNGRWNNAPGLNETNTRKEAESKKDTYRKEQGDLFKKSIG